MLKEQFNPHDPKYKKVEDLPKEEQKDFKNIEGGFVKKEAADEFLDAESQYKLRDESTRDVLHRRADWENKEKIIANLKKLDFSKKENQEKFDKLPKEKKENIINKSQGLAMRYNSRANLAEYTKNSLSLDSKNENFNYSDEIEKIIADEEKYIKEWEEKINTIDFKTVDISILEKIPDEFLEEAVVKLSEESRVSAIIQCIGLNSSIPNKFVNFGDTEGVVNILIHNGYGRQVVSALSKYFDNFKIASLLIKSGYGSTLLYDMCATNGLESLRTKKFAVALVKEGLGIDVAKSIKEFPKSDHEKIAQELLDRGSYRAITYYLKKFHGLDHKEIANTIINAGSGDIVADNLNNFNIIIDKKIINKLIDTGHIWPIRNNLEVFRNKFPGIDELITDELQKTIKNSSENVIAKENIKKMVIEEKICQHSSFGVFRGILENIEKKKNKTILNSLFKNGILSNDYMSKKSDIIKPKTMGPMYQKEEVSNFIFLVKNGILPKIKEKQKAGMNLNYNELFNLLENDRYTYSKFAKSKRGRMAISCLKDENWIQKWSRNCPHGGHNMDQQSIALKNIANFFIGTNLISSYPPRFIKKSYLKTGDMPHGYRDQLSILFKKPSKKHVHDLSADLDKPLGVADLGIATKVSPKNFVAVVINSDVNQEIPKEILNIIPNNIPIIKSNFEIIRMPKIK